MKENLVSHFSWDSNPSLIDFTQLFSPFKPTSTLNLFFDVISILLKVFPEQSISSIIEKFVQVEMNAIREIPFHILLISEIKDVFCVINYPFYL
jgi:hypothetical protein